MDKPLVSILVSTYNAEAYIAESLDSAISQTYSNTEIIVVDDCSSDRTSDIVLGYRGPRIRYIRTESRQGILKTRNQLLKEARGEYVTYLDSDDRYLPEKVSREVEFLVSNPEYAAVYCNAAFFFEDRPGKIYRHRLTDFPSGEVFGAFLERMFIANTTFMMRRSVVEKIGDYDASLGIVEDWQFFLKMARAGLRIGFLNERLVGIRLRWNSHTNFKTQVAIQESAAKIIDWIATKMTPEEMERYDMRKKIAKRHIYLSFMRLTCGERRGAWKEWLGAPATTLERIVTFPAIFIGSILPPAVVRLAVEQSWNIKKRNLYVELEG